MKTKFDIVARAESLLAFEKDVRRDWADKDTTDNVFSIVSGLLSINESLLGERDMLADENEKMAEYLIYQHEANRIDLVRDELGWLLPEIDKDEETAEQLNERLLGMGY